MDIPVYILIFAGFIFLLFQSKAVTDSIQENRNDALVTHELRVGQYTDRKDGVLFFGDEEIILWNRNHSLLGTTELIIKRFKSEPDFLGHDDTGFYLCEPRKCYKIRNISESLRDRIMRP